MIRPLSAEADYDDAVEIIRSAFRTVAVELNLTPDNAPTNPAFLSRRDLDATAAKGVEFFGFFEKDRLSGCVGLETSPDPKVVYVVRLAVLPEFRHRGIGRALMDHACGEATRRGAELVSIAIVEENARLKTWYESIGFRAVSSKRFPHLPFTVGFMEKRLSRAGNDLPFCI